MGPTDGLKVGKEKISALPGSRPRKMIPITDRKWDTQENRSDYRCTKIIKNVFAQSKSSSSHHHILRSEIHITVMSIHVFWVVTPYSVVGGLPGCWRNMSHLLFLRLE